jgi:hypothetical protein
MVQHTRAWIEHTRKRWMRTNAHLAIRHDAYRFAPPGSPRYVGKDVVRYYWPDYPDERKQQEEAAVELEELRRIRGELEALRAERRRRFELKEYNPNQPRVPAGSPDGGRWSSGATSEKPNKNPLTSFAAASRRGRSIAYCTAQYTIDNLLCSSVEPASRRAVCRAQATERFGACLAGRPIPPLSY